MNPREKLGVRRNAEANVPLKKKVPKITSLEKKSILQELRKRVERFNLMNGLAQSSAGIAFGHISRGDFDGVREDLQKILSGKTKKVSVIVAAQEDEE